MKRLSMFRPDRALIWAFSATFTSACSTVIYLIFAHQQPWAANFVQMYSCIGIISGWLNALIYYFAPRSIFLQSRKAGFLFFLAALVMGIQVYKAFFHQPISPLSLSFFATSFVPILYANSFGIEFFEGNYPWPYKRVVTFNLLLAFAGLTAFFWSRTEETLFLFTGIIGIASFVFWLSDKWNRIDMPRERGHSIKPWLNPTLPVLERTLWDQWALARLDVLNWSLPIYVLSRAITFIGNIAYSYMMGINSAARSKRIRRANKWIWAILVIAIPIAAAGVKVSWCAFLLGQIFAWLITSLLTSEFNAKGVHYTKYLLIWFLDLSLRGLGLSIAQELKDYIPFLVASSVSGIILSFLVWLKKPALPSQEKASTRFHPVDSPGIR